MGDPEHLVEGGSYSLGETDVIVVALFAGSTMEDESQTLYRFQESETGILKWKYAGDLEHQKFWELAVIWDDDSEQIPRRVSAVCIEVIGIRHQGKRSYARQPAEFRVFK